MPQPASGRGDERSGARDLADFAPYLMNRIMHRYNQSLQSGMADLGISIPKMRALAVLADKGSLSVNELAVFAVFEQPTMSRTIDQLARDGLVQRTRDEADGRARNVTLTPAGAALYRDLLPTMLEAEARMFTDIEPAVRGKFVDTLNTILKNIRVHDF